MAKVQYGAMITELTGSIGGTTFQRNRSGNIARTRSGTPKSITPKQSASERILANNLVDWQNLTLLEQQAWDTFATANPKTDRFGTVKTLSGLQFFTSVNISLELVSHTEIIIPPSFQVTLPYNLTTFTVDDVKIGIQQTAPLSEFKDGLLIFFTGPLKRTTTSFRRHLRLVAATSVSPATFLNLTTFYESAFNMTWPWAGVPGGYRIGCMIVSVEELSGITSLAVLDITSNVLSP